MCKPSLTHELRRHHRIHTVSRQRILRPPLRRSAPRKHSIFSNALSPPLLFQQFVQILGLSNRSHALRPRVIQRPEQPRRIPVALFLLRIQHARPNQKPTTLFGPRQQKLQVRRLRTSLDREIRTNSGRLQRKLFAPFLTRAFLLIEKLKVRGNSAVRNHSVCYESLPVRRFHSRHSTVFRTNRFCPGAVSKLHACLCRSACQNLRDRSNPLLRIETADGVHQSRNKRQRTRRFFRALPRNMRPNGKCVDDWLRQARCSKHRMQRLQ